MDKVSVIVPVCKSEKWIKKCIESIMFQTYRNIEIIIVIDGVFDDSYNICKKLAKNDDRIFFIVKENEGVSIARNDGIKKASGEWVCFVDSDDWIDNTYIEDLIKNAQKYESDIFIGGYIAEYAKKAIYKGFFYKDEISFENEDKDILILSCMLPTRISDNSITNVGVPWGKIYKRDFLVSNDLFFVPGLKRMQDMIFNMHAFYKANDIDYKKICNYHYNINNDSLTNNYCKDFDKIIYIIDNELKNYSNFHYISDFEEAMDCKLVLLLYEMIELQFSKDKKRSIFEDYKELKKIIYKLYMNRLSRCKGLYLVKHQKIILFLMKNKLVFILYLYNRLKNLI